MCIAVCAISVRAISPCDDASTNRGVAAASVERRWKVIA